MLLGFLSFVGLILAIQFLKLMIQWIKLFIAYLVKIAPFVLIIVLTITIGLYYLNDTKVIDNEKLKTNVTKLKEVTK